MFVEPLTKKEEKNWDTFVAQSSHSTFFHQIGWKRLIENAYPHRAYYYTAKNKQEDKIIGILPLFSTSSLFGSKKLISLPYTVLGGISAESNEVKAALLNKAIQLTKDLNCHYLELRQEDHIQNDLAENLQYYTFKLPLDKEPDQIWKELRPDIRRCIRRSKENNLTVQLGTHDIEEFFRIYALGQRNMGTPVMSFKWIQQLFEYFPDNHSIARVMYQGKTILIKFIRKYKDNVAPVLSYGLPEYRNLYPEHLILWKLIEQASDEEYKILDFGRSVKESGTYSFKLGWRANPVQLHYQYYLNKKKSIPDTSQANPARRKFAKIWRKLPLVATNTLGPVIRRYYS